MPQVQQQQRVVQQGKLFVVAVQKSQWDVKDLSEEGGGGEGNKKTETKQNINL